MRKRRAKHALGFGVARDPIENLGEIEDDDSAVRVVFLHVRPACRRWIAVVEGKLQPRLAVFPPGTLFLLALPNLFDDERR
jgi:hypothetical protein